MRIDNAILSEAGAREINEDSVKVYASRNRFIVMVADGLGGQGNGEIASVSAIAEAERIFARQLFTTVSGTKNAFRKANDKVMAMREAKRSNMMTTLTSVIVTRHCAQFAHVGDTRGYLIRDGRLIWRTVDHSAAQCAVSAGQYPDVRFSAQRNILIKAIGADKNVEPDIRAIGIQSGDRILVCSDGFWDPLSEEEIYRSSKDSGSARKWLESMRNILSARLNPDTDNFSAVTVFID